MNPNPDAVAPILTYPPLSEIDLKEYRRVYSQIRNPSHVSVLVVQLIDALAQAEQRAEEAEAERDALAKTVERCEVCGWCACSRLDTEAENTRLREALKYYADDSNSISANKFTIVDEKGHFIAPFSSFGERARAALNPPEEQTDANTEN